MKGARLAISEQPGGPLAALVGILLVGPLLVLVIKSRAFILAPGIYGVPDSAEAIIATGNNQ